MMGIDASEQRSSSSPLDLLATKRGSQRGGPTPHPCEEAVPSPKSLGRQGCGSGTKTSGFISKASSSIMHLCACTEPGMYNLSL